MFGRGLEIGRVVDAFMDSGCLGRGYEKGGEGDVGGGIGWVGGV